MINRTRTLVHTEDIFHEFGPKAQIPLRRGYIATAIKNPFAGRFESNLLPMMDALSPLGLDMAQHLIAALKLPPERIEGYGKGAIVGAAGELEHGALWHVPGGYAMRELLGWNVERAKISHTATISAASTTQPGNALAIVPSTKKVGPPGATLDVPLTHINASYVRSHFDAIECRIPGAPAADEIVVVLAMSSGPRIHARVGGLKPAEISKWDGQR